MSLQAIYTAVLDKVPEEEKETKELYVAVIIAFSMLNFICLCIVVFDELKQELFHVMTILVALLL